MGLYYDFLMDGKAIERVLDLPRGAKLEFLMFTGPGDMPMRVEVMKFLDVAGGEQRERPVGIRRITFAVEEPGRVAESLVAAGATRGDAGRVVGPAGLELELRAK
jgi:hypothetical protein